MKRAVITSIIVLVVIAALNRGGSLPRMTEITLAEPVFVIALDEAQNGGVSFTIVYEKIEGSDEGDADENRRYTKTAEGSSAAAALETLKKQFPREIAVSAADYFLIGETAARENLQKYVDFLSKDSSLRLNASVFIVRNNSANGENSENWEISENSETAETAAEILTQSKTLDIMRNYGEDSAINAFSSQMHFYELLRDLAVKDRAVAVPALEIRERDNRESHENYNQKPEKYVVPNGYAIIKNGVLLGFLDDNSSRGYNIIKNKSVNSIIEIEELGAATRLETAECKVKFNFANVRGKTELSDIELNVTINSTAIDEFNIMARDLSRDEVIKMLEKEQGRVIFDELQKTIAVSKLYDADFLGFGEMLRVSHPYKWEKIGENWDEVYLQTPVKINIDSRILK